MTTSNPSRPLERAKDTTPEPQRKHKLNRMTLAELASLVAHLESNGQGQSARCCMARDRLKAKGGA